MKDKLKFVAGKLGYGVGAIGLDLSYGMFYSFLSYYLSSVLHLEAGFLLLLTPLARIWDGINDPMMGTIVDNTKTRFGKYRPWIVIGALSNAVVLALLFNSFGMSGTKLYIYIAVMYILWGMTNTMADIPYWSMIPSFTSEEKERNLVSTVARTFSGLGQGIITILTPLIVPKLSSGMEEVTDKGYSASGFSKWAIICGTALVVFSLVCVLTTKETNVVYGEKKKFSLRQIFGVLKSNDQLLVFMLFAMLSNAGWYLTSSTATYFFADSLKVPEAQSLFQTIGAVGSILGLLVIPILSVKFSKRTIYSISLCTCIFGYAIMLALAVMLRMKLPEITANSLTAEELTANIIKASVPLDISYIFASVGISSMFVSQTIFLADIVDYGEFKNSERSESITFSMKGFLQKMAYTIQTVVLFSSLSIMHYNAQLENGGTLNASAGIGIGVVAFGVPIVFMAASLLVFRSKFKLYGKLADEVHDFIIEKRASEKK